MILRKYNTVFSQSPVRLWILRLSVGLSLAGQAYAHIVGTVPYRAVLYEQSMAGGLVSLVGMEWDDYINNPSIDVRLDQVITVLGILLGLAAVFCLFITASRKWPVLFLVPATLLIAFQAYGYYLEAGLQTAQLFEYSLQAFSPLLLAGICMYPASAGWWWFGLFLIAATFAAHGLYALGFYPIPGHFLDMTMVSTGLDKQSAEVVLMAAGTADLVVFFALFFPQTRKVALIYCIIWGILTTSARFTTYVVAGPLFWLTFQQTLPLILVRVVHFGVPMAYYSQQD